jgi:hypothetical protein
LCRYGINILQLILKGNFISCRSRWSRGLNHELCSSARTQGSCVRIPLKAWMSVCAFILCLYCPVSFRLCKTDYGTEEEARGQQMSVEPLMNERNFISYYNSNLVYYCRNSAHKIILSYHPKFHPRDHRNHDSEPVQSICVPHDSLPNDLLYCFSPDLQLENITKRLLVPLSV